ncbi:MAG: PH domain-containing protein [Solirubrobacteraceae bacterium]
MVTEPGEQLLFHGHPSWRSMFSLHLKGLLVAIGVGVVVGLASAAAKGSVQVPWVVAAVLIVLLIAFLIALIRRLATTYTITSRRLTIRFGLLSRDLHETRLERVQNVNSRQGLLDRMLGIGAVDFDTAGGAGFDFAFRGVGGPEQIVRLVDRAIQDLAGGPGGPAGPAGGV